MKAFRVAVAILCSLILATGCTLCQNPYFDCGPVWSRGTSVNCNPDYRSGSVLNRQGVPVTDDAARASQPASRTTVPAGIAAHRSDESEPRVHSTTLAQQRQTAKPQPADQRTTRTS